MPLRMSAGDGGNTPAAWMCEREVSLFRKRDMAIWLKPEGETAKFAVLSSSRHTIIDNARIFPLILSGFTRVSSETNKQQTASRNGSAISHPSWLDCAGCGAFFAARRWMREMPNLGR